MEQREIKICSPEMEQDGVFWVPMQQAEQGWDDFDLEINFASGTACRFQLEPFSPTEVVDGRARPPWSPAAVVRESGARAHRVGEDALKPSPVRQGWIQGGGEAGVEGDARRGVVWLPSGQRAGLSVAYGMSEKWSKGNTQEKDISMGQVAKFGESLPGQEKGTKITLLQLEPPLVEEIRKVAAKHPYPKQRHS
nr:unnamed protein product [Digitaria exilis]